MSKICLNFLRNSFLYSYDLCDKMYTGYSDIEILNELQKYRKFVIDNFLSIKSEIKTDNKKLNTCVESFQKLPGQDLYRQLILYMDQVVIPDPVFEQTEVKTSLSKTMGEFMGMSKYDRFNRKSLIKSINYIREIGELIDNDFIVMLPMSLMHESPKDIPVRYSPNAFSDQIPVSILNYYRSIAHVYNLEKCDSGLRLDRKKTLSLGTAILIDFEGQEHNSSGIYQYMEQEIVDLDEKTGRYKARMFIPDSIDRQTFELWVNQSINQSANHHFEDRYKELVFSKQCGCMYLTQSDLTSKVISMCLEKTSVESQLASLAMNIDLPITDPIPLHELISIRNNYGEAFHNFRTELNEKLLAIDSLADSELIQRELDKISYELINTQVEEVSKEYRKIMRTLKLDALAMVGSLIACIPTGGLTAVGCAAAFVRGLSDVGKYFTDVHENNGFFLWKVSKEAGKISV